VPVSKDSKTLHVMHRWA